MACGYCRVRLVCSRRTLGVGEQRQLACWDAADVLVVVLEGVWVHRIVLGVECGRGAGGATAGGARVEEGGGEVRVDLRRSGGPRRAQIGSDRGRARVNRGEAERARRASHRAMDGEDEVDELQVPG